MDTNTGQTLTSDEVKEQLEKAMLATEKFVRASAFVEELYFARKIKTRKVNSGIRTNLEQRREEGRDANKN